MYTDVINELEHPDARQSPQAWEHSWLFLQEHLFNLQSAIQPHLMTDNSDAGAGGTAGTHTCHDWKIPII